MLANKTGAEKVQRQYTRVAIASALYDIRFTIELVLKFGQQLTVEFRIRGGRVGIHRSRRVATYIGGLSLVLFMSWLPVPSEGITSYLALP